MAPIGFEKQLVVVKEVLNKVANVRDTTEATRCKLETTLEESWVEIFIARKIQTKIVPTLKETNEKVSCLDTLLLDEQVFQVKKKEQIDDLFEKLLLA